VRTVGRHWVLAALLILAPTFARADWQAIEKVETYTISGKTGPELYQSIGDKGPLISGKRRTIAHTNFTLTWSRKYTVEGSACILASAQPKLTITYTLPKPAGRLPDATARLWDVFFAGIRDHERVHGGYIKDLVREIETATVGMSVADDGRCVKIKTELKTRLSALFQAYQKRNRDFDRIEMGEGGNIQQLILGLVNGR
jgi:predicted secreted Zn-dependent protease